MTTIQLEKPIRIGLEKFETVTVFITHKTVEVAINGKLSKRHTVIEIKAGDHLISSGTSHCFEPDNFSRSEGRRRAIATCFRKDTDGLMSRDNRRKIFDAICPEFSTSRPSDHQRLRVSIKALRQIASQDGALGAYASQTLDNIGIGQPGIVVAKNPVVKALEQETTV